MYKTFEELYAHASDEAAYYIKTVSDPEQYQDEMQKNYALGMAFLNKKDASSCEDWAYFGFPEMSRKWEEHFDEINNALHLMHTTAEGDLRTEALEYYTLYVDGDLTETFVISADRLRLTGKSAVSDEVKDVILAEFCSVKDDLNVDIRPTWLYSHLDCGEDYAYDRPEMIQVEVTSYAAETLEYIRTAGFEERCQAAVDRYLAEEAEI